LYKLKGGTPNGIYLRYEREPDMIILWYMSKTYELNRRRDVSEIPTWLRKHCKRMPRSNVRNVEERSSNKRNRFAFVHVAYHIITYFKKSLLRLTKSFICRL